MKWRDGFDLDLFLKKLEKAKVETKDGVGFTGWVFFDVISVFMTNIVVNKDVEFFLESILHKALNDTSKSVLNAKKLTSNIIKYEKKYVNMPRKKYLIATEISIPNHYPDITRHINNVHIYIRSKFPKHIQRESFLEKYSWQYKWRTPSSFKKMYAIVSARTDLEAGSNALKEMNFLRGLWNFYYNYKRIGKTMGGIRKPVNELLFGPVHSIHDYISGEYCDNWYYEVEYNEITPHHMRNMDRLFRSERWARKRIRLSVISDILHNCFIDYCSALDSIDLMGSYLLLWSILERITLSTNCSNDITVKRIISLAKDQKYQNYIVTHLKEFRNRSVHTNYSRSDNEHLFMQLKIYVESYLETFLSLGPMFASREELLDFLDLPGDKKILHDRIRLLNKKIKLYK